MKAFVALLLLFGVCGVVGDARQDVIDYLNSVYFGAPGVFGNMTDTKLYNIFDSLTYYYDGAPTSPTWSKTYPNGRIKSEPYAATWGDCLHISLAKCVPRTTPRSGFYPMTTYLNMDFVNSTIGNASLPSNTWFEGVTYPGEWGMPMSCIDSKLMKRVYAYHGSQWLYPTTGNFFFERGEDALKN